MTTILVDQNKETATMLVDQNNPRGTEFCFYAKNPFCFIAMATGWQASVDVLYRSRSNKDCQSNGHILIKKYTSKESYVKYWIG